LYENFLEIAVAIILKDDQFLMGFRKDYQLWELPGGKIEINQKETPQEAIQREVLEEIGIHIEVPPESGVCFAEISKDKHYIIHLFEITKWSGALQNKVHEQLKWVRPFEIDHLKTHELNKILFPYIFSNI